LETILRKIYIFTSEPFPNGLAATNRISSFAKGFLYHGVDVEVICFRRTESIHQNLNNTIQGNFRSIPFKYLSASTVRSKYGIKRRIDDLWPYCKIFFFGLRFIRKDCLCIFYSFYSTPAIVLRIVSWLKGNILIKEESEHPQVYLKSKLFLSALIFKKVHYHLFDGLMLMTNQLINYFRQEFHFTKPILHVPMTVDLDRFQPNNCKKKKTISYCGLLNDEKDGTDILIKAFAAISKLFPDYTLSLYGIAMNESDWQKYQKMVARLGISDKVYFYGKVSSESIPGYLMESSILVLPRPESLQAQNGFPTKLGEYLATGNPAIVTSVGEITLYLQDKINAYIAKPGNVDSLVEKIKDAIENGQDAERIGKNGRNTVIKYFNNIVQTSSIISFYNDLI
jgi:glycosyltransferase involved in cell wall biosynthesis